MIFPKQTTSIVRNFDEAYESVVTNESLDAFACVCYCLLTFRRGISLCRFLCWLLDPFGEFCRRGRSRRREFSSAAISQPIRSSEAKRLAGSIDWERYKCDVKEPAACEFGDEMRRCLGVVASHFQVQKILVIIIEHRLPRRQCHSVTDYHWLWAEFFTSPTFSSSQQQSTIILEANCSQGVRWHACGSHLICTDYENICLFDFVNAWGEMHVNG